MIRKWNKAHQIWGDLNRAKLAIYKTFEASTAHDDTESPFALSEWIWLNMCCAFNNLARRRERP